MPEALVAIASGCPRLETLLTCQKGLPGAAEIAISGANPKLNFALSLKVAPRACLSCAC